MVLSSAHSSFSPVSGSTVDDTRKMSIGNIATVINIIANDSIDTIVADSSESRLL